MGIMQQQVEMPIASLKSEPPTNDFQIMEWIPVRETISRTPGNRLPDQPNRRVRTRTHGGVGGGSCEAPHYPDLIIYLLRESE